MRTERAPTTALSGKNISEDALAISTAILATPYAVFQTDSVVDPGLSGVLSVGSRDGEAMAFDEAARVLPSLDRGREVASSCFMCFAISGVDVGGGLFVGVAGGEGFFRKRCMVEAKATTRASPCSASGDLDSRAPELDDLTQHSTLI